MKTPSDSHDHPADGHGPHDSHTHAHGHGEEHGHHHHHHHHADGSCCGHDHHGEHAHHSHAHHTHDRAEVAAEEKEWTRRFFLFLELSVLVIWALVMIWFYASGRVEKYLVGEGLFRIQVLVAGLALLVMGLFNWIMRAQNAGCGHDHSADGDGCCGHDHEHGHAHGQDDGHSHAHRGEAESCGHDHAPGESCGHSHGHAHSHSHSHAAEEEAGHHHHHEGSVSGRGMALVLLAISVTAAAAMTADDFSNDYKKSMLAADSGRPAPTGPAPDQYKIAPDTATANPGGQKTGVTLELIEKYQKRNTAGNFELDVMQLYYSGSDPEYAAVMKGQGVETVGQVVKDPSSPDPKRLRVFVLQVSCCAADARPFSLPVEVVGTMPEVQDMGWYKLAGKIDYVEERGVTTAILKAEGLQPTVRARDPRALF